MSVDLTIEGPVAKIVLNRPDKLNALTVDMRQSLCDHFAQLRYDDAVRVVIVTGAGRAFCSGASSRGVGASPADKFRLPFLSEGGDAFGIVGSHVQLRLH